MPITEEVRRQVRQRARYACEYCGANEIDAGGELTVDHYQPQSKGGSDEFDNLLYCCARCNQHKADYWPEQAQALSLWHPRQQPFAQHFETGANGRLQPLTEIGAFTLRRLQLNRPQLIGRRQRTLRRAEERRLITTQRELIRSCARALSVNTDLNETQRRLLLELLNSLLLTPGSAGKDDAE